TQMNRRDFLTASSAGVAAWMLRNETAFAQTPLRLVLVHGRSQQGLDPVELKATWLKTLREGAAKINRSLPDQLDVAFPYYGDKLDEYATQFGLPTTEDIQARGSPVNSDFLNFQADIAEEMRKGAGVSDTQVLDQFGDNTT